MVEDRVKHPKYGKVIRRTRKYMAHDEENACGVGDRVVLAETRPLSATKRWRVARSWRRRSKHRRQRPARSQHRRQAAGA